MGFVADFMVQSAPSPQTAPKLRPSARGFLGDFGSKTPAEPRETFQRSATPEKPTPESRMRQAAIKSGKTPLASSFASFIPKKPALNQGANSKAQAAKRAKEQKVKKARTELQKLNQELDTLVKAGNVANMTEEKLRDEIDKAKAKLAQRCDQLKQKRKEKEETDKRLERNKKLVGILEARLYGPSSRAQDWKWGLGASLMNDCLDLKLGFRLDEELDENQKYRLANFLDQKRDRSWTLSDQACDKKEEVARVYAEKKVIEMTLAKLKEQHIKTAGTAERLGRKREQLSRQKEQLQDRLFRLTGSFPS